VIEGQKRFKGERDFQYLTAAKPVFSHVRAEKPKPSTERVVFLVGRAAERLQLPLHSRRRFGTPRSATPPQCPQRRPPSSHSQACAHALTNPLKGLLTGGKEPVHQVPSPETVVTGGGSDVLETGRVQGGIQSPTLTAVSRHGFLAYVELDLLKLAFERSGLLHLMYIYISLRSTVSSL
jgi:hypothetical protein